MTHSISVGVPHFQEHDRFNPVTSSDRLPAEVYGAALDYLVIGCVDLVFTCQSQVLLAKRNRPPRASWWLIGGRMTAGEPPVQAAIRKAAEEANLKMLSPDRFQLIGVYSTCFASRSQPPQRHGLHSLNITYQIELSEFEKDAIDLDPSEYEAWEWVELEQVGDRLETWEPMDEALLQVLKSLP
ncbi:NUDIX hydrolase [Phormidium tenue FACHB-886]|nr:NUDIX hydrolase [Phormidium tenue FACHB-886]